MVGMAEMGAAISLDGVAVHPDCWCLCLCYLHFAPENPEDGEMYLLVPALPGCPGQSPESCKMVVCVCVISHTHTHTRTHTHRHNHFMALWTLSGTTRVSRYQKVHFAIFWIFWCKMKITQADAPTIEMDCHPVQTNWCPHLYHPHHFYAGCPSWHNPPNFSCLGKWDRHQICWLACPVALMLTDVSVFILQLNVETYCLLVTATKSCHNGVGFVFAQTSNLLLATGMAFGHHTSKAINSRMLCIKRCSLYTVSVHLCLCRI